MMIGRIGIVIATSIFLIACQPSDDAGRSIAPFDGIGEGETVSFTGAEPFWDGEVTGTALRYSTPEDIDGAMITVERFAGNSGVSFTGELDGQSFVLMVTEGECSDTMSDRTYPFTATLEVRGEQRNGCAWTASRPFDGPENP